jgi:hypothetical protein
MENAARHSRLVQIFRAGKHSTIVALIQSFTSFVGVLTRNSFLYRWLTTEPEPDVIVIDLTETWSVGPIIRGVDRVVQFLQPRWRSSGFESLFQRIGEVSERLVSGSVSLGVFARLLQPPAEPDSKKEQD